MLYTDFRGRGSSLGVCDHLGSYPSARPGSLSRLRLLWNVLEDGSFDGSFALPLNTFLRVAVVGGARWELWKIYNLKNLSASAWKYALSNSISPTPTPIRHLFKHLAEA